MCAVVLNSRRPPALVLKAAIGLGDQVGTWFGLGQTISDAQLSTAGSRM